MKKTSNFTKSLMLHIRYPWTAAALLTMWVGLAIMCMIMNFSNQDVMTLTYIAGGATLVIALAGFRK